MNAGEEERRQNMEGGVEREGQKERKKLRKKR